MMDRKELLPGLIPRIYHEKGELSPFLEAIDRNLLWMERKIEDLPSLVDVDTCPDESLPYLAAMTNCPLWGQSAVLWRKQLKNWPYVCRMKGTKKGLRYFFESLGLITEGIDTYWRDTDGQYQTEKPEGSPYLDEETGLWRNSRTHYFSVDLAFNERYETQNYAPDLLGAWSSVRKWIEKVKPAHAELLRLQYSKYMEADLSFTVGGLHAQSGTASILLAPPEMCPDVSIFAGVVTAQNGESCLALSRTESQEGGLFSGGVLTKAGGRQIQANADDLPVFEEFEAQIVQRIGVATSRGGDVDVGISRIPAFCNRLTVGGLHTMSGTRSILTAEPTPREVVLRAGFFRVKSGEIIIRERG